MTKYEDEIYYLRTQNNKYEQINNELMMERNLYAQKYKESDKIIKELEKKVDKEREKNIDLK